MKILCCGDQHLTTKSPKNRKDKYTETVFNKFCQELDVAKAKDCKAILLPGDVFDSFKESSPFAQNELIQKLVYKIKEYKIPIFCVAGQHDQQFHNSSLQGTTLETLLAAEAMTLLTKDPIIIDNIAIYGASWNEKIPEIETTDTFNILVIHKMIVNEKLWSEQEGHTWANHILLHTKYDLIVSGDNHTQFFAKVGNRNLINLGSMMRSTIAQIDHKPAVAIIDTYTNNIDVIDLNIEPFMNVMQIEKAQKEKERNEHMDSYIKSLKKEELEGQLMIFDFINSLVDYMEKNNTAESVKQILMDCVNAS